GNDGCVKLNELARHRCQQLIDQATRYRVAAICDESGTQLVDCGVHTTGSLAAGVALAEVCLAGLGTVQIVPGNRHIWEGPAVTVQTDQPTAACMASQYAGWQIAGMDFFAMGSGPMRARRGHEKLFQDIGHRESSEIAVGVLESAHLPAADVCQHIAHDCEIDAEDLTLLVAPTSSLAGTVQVVARTIETALHKMHELGFDLARVVSGFGVAPLPPVAARDVQGIARTNDAVLYGGEVTLWITGDEESIRTLGPRIPSSASPDHGQPFAEIFERCEGDFYKIDPLLFSPATVQLVSVDSGRSFRFGELLPDVIRQSFES
ncbi:MAG: methenyltetrahydromethanopterin cyclohydrolase, partial [Pirellulaceae bacterium]|nr:methenyltetrahydromethanopterin cyclohydrolase [Pirellulaceae bacterium]